MSRKEETIRLKIAKSRSLLAEVDVLMTHAFYVSAISRLYYSCFHVTKALLLTKDIVPKTHSGVINQLHLHFVLPGQFDPSQATFFSRLLQERIDDDYSDFMIINADEVQEFIAPASGYVQYVENLIEDYFRAN